MNAPPRWASNLASKAKERMGKIKVFPVPEHFSKQPSDPVVPLVPCTGIFLGPSKSGKTVALITVSGSIRENLHIQSGVNTEREQACWEDWDEAALRGSARSPRRPRRWR